MKKLLLTAAFVTAAFPAIAQGYHYDYRTGNSYSTSSSYGGGATIRGFNTQSGSTWNTTVDSDGDMRGFDSNGNSWNYNKSSGVYMNSNGTTCIGRGAARSCN